MTRQETAFYRTRDGDAVEAVLEANPGLADHGARLPAGLSIALPPEPPVRLTRLFD